MSKQLSFEVQSGHLCFGALHNIYHGVITSPIIGFPQVSPAGRSGTVKVTVIEYNIPALTGTWVIYPLSREGQVAAYIVCHSSVDARAELSRILRVSGSPYEYEHGSRFNNSQTLHEGIFVINRYDWDYYDERSKDMVKDVGDTSPERQNLYPFASVGLVDRDAAKEAVEFWQGQYTEQRDILFEDRGAWFHMHPAEYCFGRFGFDEAKEHAQSFLFFSSGTDFFKTMFPGETNPIRKPETSYEIFERRLGDNFDFTGLPRMNEEYTSSLQPPQDELSGPHEPRDYILTDEDVRAVLRTIPPLQNTDPIPKEVEDRVRTELQYWWSESVALINEYILTFLHRRIISRNLDISSTAAWAVASAVVFDANPRIIPRGSTLEGDVESRFLHDPEQSEPNSSLPERSSVLVRLRQTFSRHSVSAHENALRDICENLAFVLEDFLEMARKHCSGDGRVEHLVPSDIRLAVVCGNWWSTDNFKYSRVLWQGKQISPASEQADVSEAEMAKLSMVGETVS